MSTMESSGNNNEGDLVSAAWIFEQIALRDGLHADRSKIRRAVDQASQTYLGAAEGGWWRWIVETGQSLGRNCRVIDGELEQIVQLAHNGMVVILRAKDGSVWHLLTVNGRRLSFATPGAEPASQVVSVSRVEKQLRQEGFEGTLRCVVVESSLTSQISALLETGEKKPHQRLLSLLRAESRDVWVVIIFALVSGLLTMTTPLAVEALVNTVAFGRFLQPVIVLSLMLLAFLIFQAAMKAVQTFVVEIIQRRLFARVAADLSFRLPRTRVEALDEKYAPELVNRFFDIVVVQKISAQLLLDGISLVLSIAVGMVVLAFYHPYLLAFDIVLVLAILFTMFVLGYGAVKTSIKESKTKYAMAAWLEDLARCRTTFRYNGAAEFALERSDQLIYDYLTARKKHFRVLMRQIIFMLLLQALASTGLLAIGGWLVISGELSLGQLVAAELIVAVVVGSLAKLGKHIESFYDLMASVDKLGSLFALPIDRTDGLLKMGSGTGIVAKDVCYSLPDGRDVLKDFSLTIKSGQKVAITGPSGCGKSLFFDILFGLREPVSGVVMVNSIDPRDMRPDVLRRHVALAREIEIFDGTIAENVHLERPDVSISDVRVALEISGLLPSIQQHPQGLDTHLTSSGGPLTTSQLRQLMVARAIAGTPDVVLLDEILDTMSDDGSAQILQRMIKADTPWTILLVTSREKLKSMMDNVIQVTGVQP